MRKLQKIVWVGYTFVCAVLINLKVCCIGPVLWDLTKMMSPEAHIMQLKCTNLNFS